MPYESVAPDVALPRGIHWELSPEGCRVHFAVTSWGERLDRRGVPLAAENDDDVIARLTVALDDEDPRQQSELRRRAFASSPLPLRRRSAGPATGVVLSIVR